MAIYSIDIKIAATAYIQADTPEEAKKIAQGLENTCLELDEQDGELPISGASFDAEDFPDLSLSPAMTVHGLFDPDAEPEEVEE